MKKDYFYETGIILLGSVQLVPLVAVFGSTIIGAVIGFAWACVLAWFWGSTIIGRKFFREWYRCTITMERIMLGNR